MRVCNEHTAPQVADLASDVERIEEGSKDAEKLLQVSPPDLLQDVSQCINLVVGSYNLRLTVEPTE